MQLYTCNGLDSTIARKQSHGAGFYDRHSCVVLEPEGRIDGINHPAWGERQLYGEGERYEWWTHFDISSS